MDEYVFSVLASLVDNRCYPDIAPQEKVPEFPFIVYRLAGVDRLLTNCGTETVSYDYQVDIYCLTAKNRNAIGKDVMSLLSDRGFKIEGYRHDFRNELRTYRCSIDCKVLNKE